MLANLKEIRQWHQLYKKEIDFSFSWKEWKECFNKAQKVHEIVSLLHYGFDAEIYRQANEFQERIFFYLEMAYGYKSIGLFSLPEERRNENFHTIFGECTVSYVRSKIAQKAWAMLCQKVFKNTEEGKSVNPSWWWIVRDDPQILDKIIWFFSEEDNIPSGIFKSNGHNNRIALDFLYTLAKLAWIEHQDYRNYQESPLPHFVKNRPKFIKILGHLGKLNFLIEKWQDVTKRDLAILETLAFRDKDKNKFKTIEEAAVAGSQYARVLIVLRVLLKENTRQEKVAEAKMEMERAKEKIGALNA